MNSIFTTGRNSFHSVLATPAVATWLIGTCALFPSLFLLAHGEYGLLLTLMISGVLLILAQHSRLLGMAAVIGFLIVLGDVRRITTMISGSRGLDPLLLVGAIFTIYLAFPTIYGVKLRDPVSKIVLGLMALMVLEIFNPLQGSIAVGISGAMFSLVPMLWFWIARRYGSDRTLYVLLFRVVVPFGVACALVGLYQSFVGFFPWQMAWVRAMGAGYVWSGGYRPFGFANSGVEYANLLMLTGVLIIGAAITGRRAYLLLLPVVLGGIIITSSRGPIVRMVFGAAIMWACSSRNVRAWIPRLVAGIVLGIGLITYSARAAAGDGAAPAEESKNVRTMATNRIAGGLAHPLDKKYSSGGIHVDLFLLGIRHGFTTPTGSGLGSTTLAAGKFGTQGSANALSTEIDISDQFVSLGFLGGFLFLFFIFLVCREVPKFLLTGPAISRLPTIGVLAAFFGGWIALGEYSIITVTWLCLGALAHAANQRALETSS